MGLTTTRGFAAFVLIASIAVLGTALLSQYLGGLAPCELCLLQRWPWRIAIGLGLVCLILGPRLRLSWTTLATAAVFACGVVFAFYHVGVEQHWFTGPTACTAQTGGVMTLEDMKRQIMGTQPVLCDQVQWSLFGISMAGFNLLASVLMTGVSLVAFRRARAMPPALAKTQAAQ